MSERTTSHEELSQYELNNGDRMTISTHGAKANGAPLEGQSLVAELELGGLEGGQASETLHLVKLIEDNEDTQLMADIAKTAGAATGDHALVALEGTTLKSFAFIPNMPGRPGGQPGAYLQRIGREDTLKWFGTEGESINPLVGNNTVSRKQIVLVADVDRVSLIGVSENSKTMIKTSNGVMLKGSPDANIGVSVEDDQTLVNEEEPGTRRQQRRAARFLTRVVGSTKEVTLEDEYTSPHERSEGIPWPIQNKSGMEIEERGDGLVQVAVANGLGRLDMAHDQNAKSLEVRRITVEERARNTGHEVSQTLVGVVKGFAQNKGINEINVTAANEAVIGLFSEAFGHDGELDFQTTSPAFQRFKSSKAAIKYLQEARRAEYPNDPGGSNILNTGVRMKIKLKK